MQKTPLYPSDPIIIKRKERAFVITARVESFFISCVKLYLYEPADRTRNLGLDVHWKHRKPSKIFTSTFKCSAYNYFTGIQWFFGSKLHRYSLMEVNHNLKCSSQAKHLKIEVKSEERKSPPSHKKNRERDQPKPGSVPTCEGVWDITAFPPSLHTPPP